MPPFVLVAIWSMHVAVVAVIRVGLRMVVTLVFVLAHLTYFFLVIGQY